MTCVDHNRPAPAFGTTAPQAPVPAGNPPGTPPAGPGRRVTVAVYASDPVLHVGIVHQLRQRPEIEFVDDAGAHRAQVSLVAVDSVDDETAALLYRLRHNGETRTGLVVGTFESGDALQRAIECGVTAVLRRTEADQDRLLRLVLAIANGEGVLPGDLLAKLLDHVGVLQRSSLDPRAVSLSTLTAREADMLRLVSEGLDTAEIARKTSYSERTVKNVLHEIITRLHLRNRTHAVGYALRNGLI
ncbi:MULTISPECIES: helix-turn-helix transcriptional regulator [unclassified Streptomyces]|uniref:helix-turn-helix transcriptional regulator n=1 Tax=unclassified Streptomyces TaxID=2593676 RepID=UPI002E36BD17|nr:MULTISPECIES: response regulator transcription factor [unclassified Streptomyces]WUC68459.1 response regulator transcription factor [Streptomyces sp. NBC_00539]